MNILGVGNSFSDDSFKWLYPILQELGVEASVNNLYIGGCSIDKHMEMIQSELPGYDYRNDISNPEKRGNTPESKIKDVLPLKEWDVITFQQCSGFSGVYETYQKLPQLIDYVTKNTKGKAKRFWNMTWAYKQTYNSFAYIEYYGANQATMYENIIKCAKKVAEEYKGILELVPTGTAIQNARTSEVGDNLTRDGFHLSYDFGRYIAALTWAIKLTGKDISNIQFAPDGVDEFRKRIAIRSAIAAVKEPFKITKITGKE